MTAWTEFQYMRQKQNYSPRMRTSELLLAPAVVPKMPLKKLRTSEGWIWKLLG
jgi:hypothetical protein